MILLAIDTSTEQGSIAIARDGVTLAVEASQGGSHTVWLLAALDRLLRETGLSRDGIDGFGIVIGPGSFTGLRIGIATTKGLAAASGRGCAPVVSLDAMAAAIVAATASATASPRRGDCTGRILAPVIDARKGEVYFALYTVEKSGLKRLREPSAASPQEFLTLSAGAIVGGNGTRLPVISDHAGIDIVALPPVAPEVAAIAFSVFSAGNQIPPGAIEPIYLRKPEAEIKSGL